MRTWLCVSECDETLGYLLAVTLDLLSPTLVAGTGHPPPFWRRSAQAIARAHAIVLWRVDADRPRHIYHCQFPPRQGRLTAIVVLHCATEAPSKLAITAQASAPLSPCPPAQQLLGSQCSLGPLPRPGNPSIAFPAKGRLTSLPGG
jgi:hypothetical protein